MKKNLLLAAGILSIAVLSVACQSNTAESTTAAETTVAAESTAAESKDGESTEASQSAANTEVKEFTIGATPAPHAEILEVVKPLLAKKGYELKITVYNDYVAPNLAVDAGDLDANFFQHYPYLESFNTEKGTKVVSAGTVHYEPFGIYAGKTASLEELADGAKVAVPNDVTNEARALQLLAAQGLITLKDGVGLEATKNDIVENPKNLEIVEVEAAQVPRNLQDVDIAVINGNYAIEAGLKVNEALAVEDATSEAATTFANILAVKEGNESSEAVLALLEVLQSEEVKKFIDEKYEGAVVPLF